MKIYLLACLVGGSLSFGVVHLGAYAVKSNPKIMTKFGVHFTEGVSYIKNNACTIDTPEDITKEELQLKLEFCIKHHFNQ
jgi:hypothetical protein